MVAVSTFVARNKRPGAAWLLGAFWGLGHAAVIFLVGVLVIFLKTLISDPLASGLETAVGVMLVLLGLLNMAGRGLSSWGVRRHSHSHDHDDPEHSHGLLERGHTHGPHAHAHVHGFEPGWLLRHWRGLGRGELFRAALVGLVHGLAGSAAVTLLVLASIPETRSAVLFLIVFGLGNIAGMLALSALMEQVLRVFSGWWASIERVLIFGTGLLSFLFGLWVIRRA